MWHLSTVGPVRELVDLALAEDLGEGDLTTAAVVPEGATAGARIDQKAPGVLAGIEVAEAVFARLDSRLRWESLATPAEWREPGPVAAVEGPAAPILGGERVALNLLGRLSGIATLTARYVRAVQGTGARILDTRKTTPGLRELEKQAVVAGGGVSHRRGLYDAVLIKENHAVLAGGVGPAARAAVERAPAGTMVEVECRDLAEVSQALEAGVPRILLDNMEPDQLSQAVSLVGERAELEASGGVSLDTVKAIAETGVDFISVGTLTHSAPALDLSLVLEPA